MTKTERIRNFAFILYQESAPPDWEQRLRLTFANCFYILHDKDTHSDKSQIKPHYHVLVCLGNPRTLTSIKRLVGDSGACNDTFQKIHSVQSYARYLCHLDDKDKFQYDPQEVVSVGNIDYSSLIATSDSQITEVAAMLDFITSNQIYSFCDLVDYTVKNKPMWFKILCNSSQGRLIRDYIKSYHWKHEKALRA